MLSTALKMQGIAALDRGLALIGQVGSAKPEALDLIHTDRFISRYLNDVNFDPRAMSTESEIQEIRQARAKQQQEQAQQQQMQVQADAAKTLSETKTGEDNALTHLLQQAVP
jgi:rRNA maturation endonuclease Nob1